MCVCVFLLVVVVLRVYIYVCLFVCECVCVLLLETMRGKFFTSFLQVSSFSFLPLWAWLVHSVGNILHVQGFCLFFSPSHPIFQSAAEYK